MVTKEEMEEIVLKEKERKLSISRVPKHTKEEFIAFAEAEFCGDYGMCLKSVWDNYKMSKVIFENNSMKLDLIINRLNKDIDTEKSSGIKLLDGKVLKGGSK